MRVVQLSSEAYAAINGKEYPSSEARMTEYRAAAQRVQDELNAPVELDSARKIAYSDKAGCYLVTFSGRDKDATLKVTDNVAAFITEHLRSAGTWRGRIETGVLVDAYLIAV